MKLILFLFLSPFSQDNTIKHEEKEYIISLKLMATSDNLPLRDLQRIILGQRTEPLSVMEIRNLFSYPTTPESILYLITALDRNKIDPNSSLIHAIDNANKKEDLVPVALSLRYGADPNLYVNYPNVGDIHILGFVYLVLKNKTLPLLNSIVIMLMAMGSDPNRLIFDAKGGVIRDEYSLVEPLRGQSVIDWLEEQGYSTIIPQIEGQKYDMVEKGFMTTLAVLLDNPELIPKGSEPKLDEIISAHSVEVFNKLVPKSEQNGIELSRKYLNIDAYEKYVDLGASLNYFDINEMILLVKKYKELGDIISMNQVGAMLLYSVSKGLVLDSYQIDLIKSVDNAFYTKINTTYSQPYWTKICPSTTNSNSNNNDHNNSNSNIGIVDDKLKNLAYRLNLYPEAPKDTLCYQIKLIAQADPELVKKSAITRQQVRIKSDVAYINQFDNGDEIPNITCNNRSVLSNNLYDFPDVDIAYYRDYQDALWCFTSNNFLKITETETNPYTNEPFPQFFLEDVKRKIYFISKYRSLDEDPTPISVTIDELSMTDEPNNIYTSMKAKEFDEMLAEHNLTQWNIDKLSIDDMKNILNVYFGKSIDLELLTREHAERTFIIIAYDNLKSNNDIDLSDRFFKQIGQNTKIKSSKSNMKLDMTDMNESSVMDELTKNDNTISERIDRNITQITNGNIKNTIPRLTDL